MDNPVRNSDAGEGQLILAFTSPPTKNLVEYFQCHGRKNLEILLLGCRDIGHVLLTSVSLSQESTHVRFTLNVQSLDVIAKDALLFFIISSANFNPDEESDVEFVFNVWYNLNWTEDTKARFLVVVDEFIKNGCETTWMSVTKDNVERLQMVTIFWKIFLSNCDFKRNSKPEMCRKIRYSCKPWTPVFTEVTIQDMQSTVLSEAARILCLGRDLFPSKTQSYSMLEREVLDYHLKGNVGTEVSDPDCFNPTYFFPSAGQFDFTPCVSPFTGYYPLPAEKLSSKQKSVFSVCRNILAGRIRAFRKLVAEQRVRVHFVSDSPVRFLMQSSEEYDVIDTSDLADRMGLANLLVMVKPLMADESLLLTEAVNPEPTLISAADYFAEVLGFGPEMFPSIFGLRLLRDLVFGNELPSSNVFYTFEWKKVPLNRPRPLLDLEINFELRTSLCELTRRCCLPKGVPRYRGIEYHTPMTLAFTLRSMNQRFDFDVAKCLRQIACSVPNYSIAFLVAAAWISGEELVEVQYTSEPLMQSKPGQTSQEPSHYITRVLFVKSQMGSHSSSAMENGDIFEKSQFVDNVDVEIIRDSDSITSIRYSFLLTPALSSRLQSTAAVLYDVTTGLPLVRASKAVTTRQRRGYPQIPRPVCSGPFARTIVRFLETSVGYEVDIRVDKREKLDGVVATGSSTAPCESTHDVLVSFPRGTLTVQRLTLGFPVLVKSIRLEVSGNLLRLKLQKAVNHLWPMDVEFWLKDRQKFPEKMILWNSIQDKESLGKHLELQFTGSQLRMMELNEALARQSPAMELRRIIQRLFLEHRKGNIMFAVFTSSKSREPAEASMILRCAQHISCYGPLQIPLLVVTVLEPTGSEGSKNIMELENIEKILNLKGESWGNKKKPPVFVSLNIQKESLELFRRLLLRNSLQIHLDGPQTNAGFVSEPWLGSFITPLYIDNPGAVETSSVPVFQAPSEPRCRHCNRLGELKRCSKCRQVFYCGVQCQRLDWPQHKNHCSKAS